MTAVPRIKTTQGDIPHLDSSFGPTLTGPSAATALSRRWVRFKGLNGPCPRRRVMQTLRCGINLVWIVLLALAGFITPGAGMDSNPHGGNRAPRDLEGHPVDPLRTTTASATVLIFVQPDCPISNRYAPEVKRLYERFASKNIAFHLVYPDPTHTPDRIRAHLELYNYPCGGLRDPYHVLVAAAGATVTPEAAVFVGTSLVYRGRIDDRFIDFGKARIKPTQRDLETVLLRLAQGETPALHTTQALGCFISDLTP